MFVFTDDFQRTNDLHTREEPKYRKIIKIADKVCALEN